MGNTPASGKEARQFFARRRRPHERFANQEGMDATGAHPGHVFRSENSTFGDNDTIRRNAPEQA